MIPGCLLGWYLFNWFVIAGRMSDRARALMLPDFCAFHFRERVPLLRILSVIVLLYTVKGGGGPCAGRISCKRC